MTISAASPIQQPGVGVSGYVESLRRERDRFVALAFCAADLLLEINAEGKINFAAGATQSLVGALLAAAVGNALGAVSVSFLDHFTLFEYGLHLSWRATATISAICLFTCLIAAVYPAFVATRTSSAESLHYE